MSDFEVIDAATGQPVVVPEEEATTGLAEGRYTATGRVDALSPEGALITLPPETLAEALRSGYRLDTPEQRQSRAERREFEDRPVAAFGARGLGAASFGGTDVLARTLGGEEAARVLRGLEEHNPGASLAGEVFGSVAPLLVPGGAAAEGAGLAGRLLRGASAPSRAVARLAEGAGARLAGTVARGEAGLARRLAGRALGGAAEGAIEGIAGEAGRLVTEEALGYEPDLSGQALLARLGTGAAIGGTLGGGFGLAGGAIREGADVVRRAYQTSRGVPLHPVVARVVSAASGAPEEALHRLAGADGALVDDIVRRGDAVLDDGAVSLREALDELNAAGIQGESALRMREDVIRRHMADMAGVGARPQHQAAVDDLMRRLREVPDAEVAAEVEALRSRMQGSVEEAGTLQAAGPRVAPPPPPETAAGRRGARAAAIAEEGTAVMPGRRGRLAAQQAADVAAVAAPGAATGVNDVGRVIEAERLARGGVPQEQFQRLQRLGGRMTPREVIEAYVNIDQLANRIGDMAFSTTDRSRRIALESLHSDLREFLTSEPLWGSRMANFQRRVSSRVSGFRAARADAERMFFARSSRAEGAGVRQAMEIDPGRIANFIRKSGMPSNTRAEEVMRRYIDEVDAFNRSLQEAFEQPVGGSVERAARRARQALDESVEKATILNHWRDIERAGLYGNVGPAAAGIVGHMIGGPIGGLVGAAGAMASNPARVVRSLSAIRQAIRQVDEAIGESVRRFLSGTSRMQARPGNVTVRSLTRAYDARVRLLEEQSDPATLTERVGRSTADLAREAPETQSAVIQATVAGTMFLQERRPRSTSATGTLFPEPSQIPVSEMDRFMRYARAVDTPMSVIEDLEAGTLSREGVEVLQRVYPALYQHLVRNIIEEMTSRGRPPEYSRRIYLGRMLGIPTDYSLTPGFANDVQGMYTAHTQESQDVVPRRSDPEVASAYATETDRLESES